MKSEYWLTSVAILNHLKEIIFIYLIISFLCKFNKVGHHFAIFTLVTG